MGNPYNLIGNPANDALNQLKARSALLSQPGFHDDKHVAYKARTNQAFAKLSSFVEVTDPNLAKAVGEAAGVNLAQKWSLFNGFNNTNGDAYNVTDIANNLTLSGYGQGGVSELGIRPMPGIKSVVVKTKGMAGSLREAVVTFSCHNMQQLNIIDVLYFRFGFSMLLEWGHTIYADNGQNIRSADGSLINVFSQSWTKESILKELAKRRRSSDGNYDGMLGLVTNYNWSFRADGGYDCTLTLTGIGSILESLKVNSFESAPAPQYTPGAGPTAPAPSTGGSSFIQSSANVGAVSNVGGTVTTGTAAVTAIQQATSNQNSTLAIALGLMKQKATELGADGSRADFGTYISSEVFSKGLNLLANPTAEFKKGYNARYMSGVDTSAPDINLNHIATYHYLEMKAAEGGPYQFAYIPLGLLLALINNSCSAYDKDSKGKKPLMYIDFNPETNYCLRFDGQISVDPGVCLLGNYDKDNVAIKNYLTARGVDISKMNPGIPTEWLEKVQEYLAPYINAGEIGRYQDTDASASNRGKLMNILVNIDFIVDNLATQAEDKNGNIYLSPFLTNILNGIAKVTGMINKFTVTYDDESNCVRIIDEQMVHNTGTTYPVLPVFGLSSVLRKLDLKTNASSQIGSMLAIEARAGARRHVGDTRDGSAFTALNSKLKDRLIIETDLAANENPDNTRIVDIASKFSSFRYEMYWNFNYNKTDCQTNANFYGECMNALKNTVLAGGEVTADSTTAKGILPIALNMTMNGISNFTPFEGFTLPGDRVPAQYKELNTIRIGFVVSTITHTVQGQSWTTDVTAQMVNIPPQNIKNSGVFIPTVNKTKIARLGKGSTTSTNAPVVPGAPPANASQLGFKWPVATPFTIAGFFGRSGTKKRGAVGDAKGGTKSRHYGYDMTGPNGYKRKTVDRNVGSKGTNGDVIYAVHDGKVGYAGVSGTPDEGYGNVIYIDHNINGVVYTSIYGHVPPQGMFVKAGDVVKAGQAISYMGTEGSSGGYHLHFELWQGYHRAKAGGDKAILLDPADYLPLFVEDGGFVSGGIARAGVQIGPNATTTTTAPTKTTILTNPATTFLQPKSTAAPTGSGIGVFLNK